MNDGQSVERAVRVHPWLHGLSKSNEWDERGRQL